MTFQTVLTTRRGALAGCSVVLTLAGCGSLLGPSNPPPQIYRLAPAFPGFVPGSRLPWQIAVARAVAPQSLDTERIALVRGAAMDYYADAQWNDSVPRLLQSLMVEALEQSGRVRAAARESEAIHADYTLEMEVRNFDAEYASENGAPEIVVELSARLVGERGVVMASHDERQSVAATSNSIPAVVQAFDAATGKALAQLVNWVLQSAPPAERESR